jgi:hypothetical protein
MHQNEMPSCTNSKDGDTRRDRRGMRHSRSMGYSDIPRHGDLGGRRGLLIGFDAVSRFERPCIYHTAPAAVVVECIGVGLLLVRRATRGSVALGALLILLAGHISVLACQELGLIGWHVTIAHLAGLAYGPLFALFIRELLYSSEGSWLGRLPHLVPLIVFLIALVSRALSGEALVLGVFASLGTYLAIAVADVTRYRAVIAKTRSDVHGVPLAWLNFAVAGLFAAYALDVATFIASRKDHPSSSLVLETLLYVALSLYVMGFVVAVLRYPRLFATVTLADVDAADASKSTGAATAAGASP